MDTARFRILLLTYALTAGASIALGLSEFGYPPGLKAAFAAQPDPEWIDNPLVLLGLVALIASSLLGLIGMFLIKRWGRSLSLWTTVAALAVTPFLGASLSSPLEDLFAELASLIWGAAIALAYLSPFRAEFDGRLAGDPNGSAVV